tara:strand:+ start:114 stop:293 length:180 start_codon:yes stop_codon:yes gene_type:complete
MVSKIGYYDVNEEWIKQQQDSRHDQSPFKQKDTLTEIKEIKDKILKLNQRIDKLEKALQ